MVGVSKTGGGSGNGIGAVEEPILSLTLRVLEVGATTISIEGPPGGDPAALDSNGVVVGRVIFDPMPAQISGQ